MTIGEICAVVKAAGAPVSEAKKGLNLTESIANEKLAAGTVSHIIANPALTKNFTAAAMHIVTTAAHLNIIGPKSEDQGGKVDAAVSEKLILREG